MASSGAILAIDHGTIRTGFAATDESRILSAPLDVFRGAGDGEELLQHIAGLLDERRVSLFLVGLPYNMDGSEGPRAAEVRAFAQRLAQRFPTPELRFQDERLSTKEADELLAAAGHFGADRKARRDSWSALVILRDYLA
ncbi:MAG: Holliday junction resolvase RuvX [Planctomycetota bacterium]|jgi:putative Holliday junction resolvase|nr:Holliday junction resolvase RuvX [Planctomycetota bacterium]MDP6368866.1 Holliday junction resolvase RuvX [Planctomycetota bacterium]MDP6520073.1 Holliday junction resolvase RuvX [Planctomycetota bacterium]MDP6837711.1 Holliday junction resolvase RuvX [Planctomycetota bacterium]MDP6956375.1 Holliday junction resolvase RuvX [Planctomycetota bacterium]